MAAGAGNRFVKSTALLVVSGIVALGIAELVARSLLTVRNVGPSFTAYDPVYGKALKKNFRAKRITPEFTMAISTNSLGFRGAEPESFPDGPVLFLGDSFTLGYGVNDGEEFPALIKQKLDDHLDDGVTIPVVNGGLGDTGNGRWVKFLEREARAFNPRLVVLQVMANDFADNESDGLYEISAEGELRELPPRPRSRARVLQSVIESVPGLANSYLVGLARQLRGVQSGSAAQGAENNGAAPLAVKADSRDELTLRLVDRTLALCKQERYPVLALIVGIGGERLQKLESLLNSYGVLSIAVPEKAERPELYYVTDGHWNASGHQYVADVVFDELISRNLLGL